MALSLDEWGSNVGNGSGGAGPAHNHTADDYEDAEFLDCEGASGAVPEGIASAQFQVLVWGAYSSTLTASVVGNCSVIAIVATQPHMRTVTNLFLANLALGDLLMTLFCVPFTFVSLFVLQYWPFGGALCRVVNYCQAVSVLVSAYTLVALSADRYRAIMWPMRPRRRLRKPCALRLIALVWFGAAATALPIPLYSALVQPSRWHAHCGQAICTEVWPEPAADRTYSLALMIAQFAVPLVALVYTYGCIGWRVWARRPPHLTTADEQEPQQEPQQEPEQERPRFTWRHRTTTTTNTCTSSSSTSVSSVRQFRRARKRTLAMTLAVVAAFVVCWLPFNAFMLAPLDDPTWPPLPYLYFAFHWLAMSHCCYNPLIYCYMNAKFRAGFRTLLLEPFARLYRRAVHRRLRRHRRPAPQQQQQQHPTGAGGAAGSGSVSSIQTEMVQLTTPGSPSSLQPSPW
uniref:G-protein coupled receptors family 1 profile domain-containing protein n=1 Tax=Anopheles atroparvus TaxID=41427 RepID=A0A182J7T8_ANOAO